MVQVVQQWISHTGKAKDEIFVQPTNLSSTNLALKVWGLPGEVYLQFTIES